MLSGLVAFQHKLSLVVSLEFPDLVLARRTARLQDDEVFQFARGNRIIGSDWISIFWLWAV